MILLTGLVASLKIVQLIMRLEDMGKREFRIDAHCHALLQYLKAKPLSGAAVIV